MVVAKFYICVRAHQWHLDEQARRAKAQQARLHCARSILARLSWPCEADRPTEQTDYGLLLLQLLNRCLRTGPNRTKWEETAKATAHCHCYPPTRTRIQRAKERYDNQRCGNGKPASYSADTNKQSYRTQTW